MKAYKCDRCGKYMDSTIHMFNFDYFVTRGNNPSTTALDLCRDCMKELNDWMEKKEGEEDDSED